METEDEVVGWHQQLNEPESEHTLGGSEGQGAWRAAVHGVPESELTGSLNSSEGNSVLSSYT